jgi:hypothetical protein
MDAVRYGSVLYVYGFLSRAMVPDCWYRAFHHHYMGATPGQVIMRFVMGKEVLGRSFS